ncbi:hypothetical protein AGLY_001757 [Aphis glycines]|uniref:Tetratricopeptide repeat protein 39B n=1 Tax=Aphis glycines TaxID=307491 RepID=A0A6G0U4M6_APHGL|nr:hypothetical protein AGLY_001757 [Aphis glycines]
MFITHYSCVHCSDVPKYKQRIAGKSLPMEKFAVKRSQRFTNQNNRLFMPAIELLYLWNLFNVFGKRKSLCDNLYRLIDKNTKDLEKNPGQYSSEYEYDNKALGCLLKGVCLRIMNSPLHAEECLKSVISMEKKIKEDRFLVPYAHVELAFLYKTKGNPEKAAYYLDIAKKNYSGYSLETRLHFQIHCAWSTLNEHNTTTTTDHNDLTPICKIINSPSSYLECGDFLKKKRL